MIDLSIIIPLSKKDNIGIVTDLMRLPPKIEIVFVGPESEDNLLGPKYLELKTRFPLVRYVTASSNLAHKLNKGARVATKQYLWFLDTEMRFRKKTFEKLEKSLNKKPQALHYFDLAFLNDGPWMMFLNELGYYYRAHLRQFPVKDQAFCIKKDIFLKLGGFPEDLESGIDRIFIDRIKKAGIPLRCTQSVIKKSASGYEDEGWWKNTRQVASSFNINKKNNII